jgi:hypothetical protein
MGQMLDIQLASHQAPIFSKRVFEKSLTSHAWSSAHVILYEF